MSAKLYSELNRLRKIDLNLQKKFIKKLLYSFIFGVIIFISIPFFQPVLGEEYIELIYNWVIFVVAFYTVIVLILYSIAQKKYQSTTYFHEVFIPSILSRKFLKLKKSNINEIIQNTFLQSNSTRSNQKTIYYKFWRFTTELSVEDEWCFEYKQRLHYIAESTFVTTEQISKEHKRTFEEKMLFVKTQVDHEFTGNTVVYTKDLKFMDSLNVDLEQVELESVRFDELFYTKANSQVDARICLKTNVMQNLLEL